MDLSPCFPGSTGSIMSLPGPALSGWTRHPWWSVSFILPEAEAGPDRIIGCDEDEVILGTPPMPGQIHTIYSWSLGSGPIAITPIVSVDAIGTYVLQAIDTVTGCLATDAVVVTAGQLGPVAMGLEMTDPECLSDNGTIEIISVQEASPYLYQIGQNGFSGDPIFSGLGKVPGW